MDAGVFEERIGWGGRVQSLAHSVHISGLKVLGLGPCLNGTIFCPVRGSVGQGESEGPEPSGMMHLTCSRPAPG
eukprot:1141113-Pelagomonas_calceolata.AAC.1